MNSYTPILIFDFPGGSDGKSVCLQCRRPRFDPWVGKIPWRRKWHPTPVLLPGKSHGRRSLVGYSPWGRKESDTTERLHFHPYFYLLIFIFDCAGPLLLCGLFSSCGKWGLLRSCSADFSSQWLLLLWSMGSRARGLQ